MTNYKNVNDQSADIRPEIDLESEDMDPALVLFGSDGDGRIPVKVPVPEAQPFNNLDEYYKKTFSKKNAATMESQRPKRDPEISRLIRQRALPLRAEDHGAAGTSNQANLPDVIKKMENSHGPMNLLYGSIDKKIKVFIRRRKLALLREERFSWLSGHLVAFDKHFNLVLKNVVETYQHRCFGQVQKIEKQTNQLFIRGDNVILVVRPP